MNFADFLRNPAGSFEFVDWLRKFINNEYNRHGKIHKADGSDPIPSGAWHYATPIAPATPPNSTPEAQFTADPLHAAFKNAWANTVLTDGTSYSPLRWRFTPGGKKQLEGAIDGGALGTVCVTLPEVFWPLSDESRVISSVDGSRSMTVSISATNGDVTVIGFPQSAVTLSANQVTTSTIADGAVTEAKITLADNTTDDVTSAKHGFAPKSPADATKFLNGAATPAYAQVKDSDLSTSDITTNDVSTTKHGFVPKGVNDTAKFLRSDGTWSVVGGVTSVVAADTIWDAKGDLAAGTGADAAARLAVGADNSGLVADSSQTTGVRWAGGASVLLYDYTVSGSDKASIDTSSDTPQAGAIGPLSTAFNVLEIWLDSRTDEAVIVSLLNLTFNNDTGANYDRAFVATSTAATAPVSDGGSSTGSTAIIVGTSGASAGANVAGQARLSIANYAGTTFYKVIEHIAGFVDTTAGLTHRQAVLGMDQYRSTSTITRVAIAPATAGKKLKVGTRLIVYGR